MLTRQALPDILEDYFRMIFFDAFTQLPQEWEPFYNIADSQRWKEDDSEVGSLGLWQVRGENEPVVYDDPPAGFDTTYEHEEWALGHQVTQLAREDDRWNIIGRVPGLLGKSLNETLNLEGAIDFNNGFDTNFTGGDGKPLFALDHPLMGGGTEQNTMDTPADLDVDTLEQALIDIAATTDDRGKRIALRPVRLFGKNTLDFTAARVLQSTNDPNSANNAINPAKGKLSWYSWHYIEDPDAWFIQCSEHRMQWFWRVRPMYSRGSEFDTDVWKYKGRARWSHGWSGPFGMYGVAGGA